MNLFELFVKIGVDDQASNKLSNLSSKLGSGLKTAAKIGTAAVGAAAAGITALTTAAVNNYAEYEQLVGGVETLFKDSANTLMSYASEAYKAQGISANEYMSLATSFSASLLQSLEGDTKKAVEATNLAITDMSDNANKMGTSMELIQNAYNGFAKANYTMLDNLKLGYGGTKEEMARLIADAAALSDTVDAQSMSFDNIVEAIHVVQTEMGITGTTAKEASTTISGSVGTMKAAWTDFLTSLADENADYQWQLDNLLESVKTVAGNVFPVVEQVFWSISDMVEDVFPEIASKIPQIISEVLPRITEIAVKLVESLAGGISENQEMLMTTAFETITYLANSFITMLPKIVELGFDLIVSLASGISKNMNELVATVFDLVQYIVDAIIENSPALANAAFGIIDELGNALAEQIPGLSWVFENLETAIIAVTTAVVAYKAAMEITSIIDSVKNAMTAFKAATEGQTLAQTLLNAVMNANPFILVATLVAGLVAAVITLWHTNEGFRNAVISAWESIKSAAEKIFTAIANFFTETIPNAFQSMIDWISDGISYFVNIGYEIVDNIKSGISAAWDGLVSWFSGIWNSLFGGLSVNVNVNKTSSGVNGSHAGGLNYVPFDGYIAELHKGERVLTAAEARGYNNRSNNSGYDERPIKIVVQSVLDGKVIGETAYNYNRRKARAVGT